MVGRRYLLLPPILRLLHTYTQLSFSLICGSDLVRFYAACMPNHLPLYMYYTGAAVIGKAYCYEHAYCVIIYAHWPGDLVCLFNDANISDTKGKYYERLLVAVAAAAVEGVVATR